MGEYFDNTEFIKNIEKSKNLILVEKPAKGFIVLGIALLIIVQALLYINYKKNNQIKLLQSGIYKIPENKKNKK